MIDAILLTATAGVVVAAANGANPVLFEYAKLEAWDVESANGFGVSFAVKDGTVVSGAFIDDDGGEGAGAVYVFRGTTSGDWQDLVKLTAADPKPHDHFGKSVATSGVALAVGATGVGENTPSYGAVYVFEARDDSYGWVEVAKLTASDGGPHDALGASVAMDDDTVLAGAPRHWNTGPSSGSVYVFDRDPSGVWAESGQLDVAGLQTSAFLGQSVALDGNTALVGAYRDPVDGIRSGAAYVFERDEAFDEWTQQAKLTPPDPEFEEFFGWSSALSGDWAAVGAWRDDDTGSKSGSVYLYRRTGSNWEFVAELHAPPAVLGFGLTVALEGDRLLIGGAGGASEAKTFLFKLSTSSRGDEWALSRTLLASDGHDDLGDKVAINGRNLFAALEYGSAEGVYVFSEEVFSDGFEAGDTSAWSSEVP
ncbi:MAG: FG-GAP repeat protein [Acidobacteriota bacterium]|nr:FG-GAP repeat protein [Acidobacteriota bacterium]